MGLQELTAISHYYGSAGDYVIAGGGNTSFKDAGYLYIKGSGVALAAIDESGFVKMDRAKLKALWTNTYSDNSKDREAAILADMLAARCPGEENKRPSVEVHIHLLLPFAYVVHTHPALVNGLTCSQKGEEVIRELFDAIWLPSTNPGYILFLAVKKALESYREKNARDAQIIFLQNHGVFVAADTIDEIKVIHTKIMDLIRRRVLREPDLSGGPAGQDADIRDFGGKLCKLAVQAPGWTDCRFAFLQNAEISKFIQNRAAFYPVSSVYTPDHIVYAGSDPLFIEKDIPVEEAWKKHVEKTGRQPKIVAVQGLGVFALGVSEKTARDAAELFLDSVKIAVYTESFGGPCFMEPDKIDFINNWEAEHYRSKLAEEK
jgi:rhamnose utilization protein RhaD (predicted bifunctional aldolase and dehydrogenase)